MTQKCFLHVWLLCTVDCCICGPEVSQGQRGPRGLGSLVARQSSAAGPQSLADSLRGRGWLVQKGRAERRWFHPTVSRGALLCAHPQDSSPLLTLKDACDEPALTHSSEAGPASVPPPPQEVPEPPVQAPRMSAWVSSHHLFRLSAEAPWGVITSQAFWVSDFLCFCGLSHRLRLFCDLPLPLVSPSAWGVPTTPYSVQ